MTWPWSGRIGISPVGAAPALRRRSSAISAPTTATMSVSPSRCSASWKEPSGSLVTLRRCAKWMSRREALRHRRQVVLPARAVGAGAERQRRSTAIDRRPDGAASSAFDTTRGRPKIGKGGSSGWIAILTPASSATGTISRRKATQVFAEILHRHVAIDIERAPKTFAVVDEFARRHPADQVGFELRQLAFAHRVETLARRGEAFRRMVGLARRRASAPARHRRRNRRMSKRSAVPPCGIG